jgi:hypothetical protein
MPKLPLSVLKANIALHSPTVHCTALHCTALHCTTILQNAHTQQSLEKEEEKYPDLVKIMSYNIHSTVSRTRGDRAVQRSAVQYRAVQCSAVQCSAVQCRNYAKRLHYGSGEQLETKNCDPEIALCTTMLQCTIHCTALLCTALQCTTLYCVPLHFTRLCCTMLHCTMLYCNMVVRQCIQLRCAPLDFPEVSQDRQEILSTLIMK